MTVRARTAGFSLVELMVALVISLLLIAGTISVYMGTVASRQSQEMLASIQEKGRLAMTWLIRDLRMAGNTGMTYTRSGIIATSVAALSPTVSGNCFDSPPQAFSWYGAILRSGTGNPAPMVYGEENINGATVFSGCIQAAEVVPDTDIVSVHYTSARPVLSAQLKKGGLYLHSGVGGGVLFSCNQDGAACFAALSDKRTDATGAAVFPVRARAYFIRNWSYKKGDAIPALVRMNLDTDGVVRSEMLLSGVQSLQAQYGIDDDDDGIPDRYLPASSLPPLSDVVGVASEWSKVKSVKLSLVIRSDTQVPDQPATSVTVAGVKVVVPSGYMAKPFETTVAVRNPSSRPVL